MPIPEFDHNHVLPPHIGNPSDGIHLVSPYRATSIELVDFFATSKKRIEILIGLFSFRAKLTAQGLINGFQWLDGSFVENIEKQENRSPNDLDLITFYFGYDKNFQDKLVQNFAEFADRDLGKKNYLLDHFPFDATYSPVNNIEFTRYFVQLFSHNRNKVWKGMIRIELNTTDQDNEALEKLKKLQENDK